MHCACGADVSSAKATCPACGRSIPRGVGGWLFFFIIILLLRPITFAVRLFTTFRQRMLDISHSPNATGHYFYYFGEQLLIAAVAVYAAFVAIQLLRVRPGAVRNAKRFLIVLLLFVFADYIFEITWLILMTPKSFLPNEIRAILSGRSTRYLLATGISTVIWYLYFLKSKRVSETYSSALKSGFSASNLNSVRSH